MLPSRLLSRTYVPTVYTDIAAYEAAAAGSAGAPAATNAVVPYMFLSVTGTPAKVQAMNPSYGGIAYVGECRVAGWVGAACVHVWEGGCVGG